MSSSESEREGKGIAGISKAEEYAQSVSESEELAITKREMPNRTTRGKRMNELVGKAREEDEQFWQLLGFQEAESDEDYVESSEGEDMVDSDFDKPEEEYEAEVETESTKERGTKRKPVPIPRPKPHKPRHVPLPVDSSAASQDAAEGEIQPPVKKYKRIAAETSLPLEKRSVAVREKTLERTKAAQRRFAEWEKKQIEKEQKKQDEPKTIVPDKLTQADLMKQAALTEEENLRSLKLLQQIELTRQKQGYNKKEVPLETTIRSTQQIINGLLIPDLSLIGVPRMAVTVPAQEYLYTGPHKADASKKLLNKKSLQCAISGKRARYLDPMTKMTYATKDAFKILREKFYQLEEEKLNQRIQALNELLSLKKDKHKRHKLGKQGEDHAALVENKAQTQKEGLETQKTPAVAPLNAK